jgi:mRNA interferase MazF
MGPFAAGQVVIVRFPFSDLTVSKLRPAIVVADAGRGDWILCQVTSQPYGDPGAVTLDSSDFERGALRVTSYARPGKLFTAHASLVAGRVADLRPGKFRNIREAIVRMIEQG